MARINISISEDALKKVDKYKEIVNLTRSGLIIEALESYFARLQSRILEEKKKKAIEGIIQIRKIIIPELSAFELANVLRNKIKKYQNVNLDIIDRLYNLGIIFYIDKEILKIATKIAADINESVYDCIFIATAERFNCKLVTDDNSLFLNYAGYSSKKIEILLLENYRYS